MLCLYECIHRLPEAMILQVGCISPLLASQLAYACYPAATRNLLLCFYSHNELARLKLNPLMKI